MRLHRRRRDDQLARRSRRWRAHGPSAPAPAARGRSARRSGARCSPSGGGCRRYSSISRAGQGRRQQRLAGADGPDALDEPVGRRRLEQEAGGAGARGRRTRSGRGRTSSAPAPCVGDPASVSSRVAAMPSMHRHPDVHQHHVGLGTADHVDRLAAVPGDARPPRSRGPRAPAAAPTAPAPGRRRRPPGSCRRLAGQRDVDVDLEAGLADGPWLQRSRRAARRARPSPAGRARSRSSERSRRRSVHEIRSLSAIRRRPTAGPARRRTSARW